MAELMKGKVWKDHKHKLAYPVSVDVKYDEVRCHVVILSNEHGTPMDVQFYSYAGKVLANMKKFENLFLTVARVEGWREFDCGFEVNGSFNDTYRWVRSTRGLPADLQKATWRFFLFDLPQSTLTYRERLVQFMHVREVADAWYLDGAIQLPKRIECKSESEVEAAFAAEVQRGHEGLMVKTYDHTYQRGKRIDGWLKFKPEETADGEIIELLEAHATVDDPERGVRIGDPLGRIGSVRVRLEDGSEACPHGIAHDLGIEMKLNPQAYLREWVEFKYMMRDRQGGYRHCTFKRLREAKQ